MTMPETLKVTEVIAEDGHKIYLASVVPDMPHIECTEYIRADLVQTRLERLEKALRFYAYEVSAFEAPYFDRNVALEALSEYEKEQ